MPSLLNNSITVSVNEINTSYFFSPKHRGNPTSDISVWVIEVDRELDCFSNSLEKGWYIDDTSWGCIPIALDDLLILGGNLVNTELVIAKFVLNQNLWHGYPADIRRKPKDRPLPKILLDWLSKGIISKSKLARIKQGQI